MALTVQPDLAARQADLEPHFAHWEKIKDCIDQNIDVFENYRQSGHPGGSRSKVHMLVALTLGGFMRWDIRHPEKRFGDRFILVAGHTVPVIYATLAVYNTALQAKYARTRDPRYLVPHADERQLTWRDLLGFRRNRGLAGHAEMEGKTLFLKFNTGPSGHGSPPAAGEAMALKRAGADGRQGLRGRRRRRTDAGREPRDQELGLRARARQPALPHRLERLGHRRGAGQPHRARRPAVLVRAVRLPRARRRSRAATSPSVTRAFLDTMHDAQSRPASEHDLVQDHQGPWLHRHRLQVARHAAPAELRAVLAAPQRVRRQVRHQWDGCRTRPPRAIPPSCARSSKRT